MQKIEVTLPEQLSQWVRGQIGDKYANAEDYLRELVRRDQREADKEAWLHQALVDGENSGIYEGTVEDIIAECKATDSPN